MDPILASVRTWFEQSPLWSQTGGLAVLLALAILAYYLLRRVIVSILERLAHRTDATWDDELHRHHVFDRLAYIPPVLLVTYGVHFVPDLNGTISLLVQRVAFALFIIVVARSLGAFLRAANAIYSANPEIGHRSIKGYLQVIELVLYLVTAILVIATLMDRSPLLFLSGLGAMTAVLLLVFRDTLLGLVASVQIATNDMVRVGDWIEMPEYGADGDVIDIALHTVKIQNWDKTITTVPTSKLIERGVKNWRGMTRAGGRRIKRSLLIDLHSIRFLEEDELGQFGRFALLRDYIEEKRRSIAEFNTAPGRDQRINADIRRLTNIGTLRAYILAYLRNHPDIHKGMTLLVRQLAATPDGLPLEIYCFTSNTDWGPYEQIQADIFDHVFAILPDFGLRVFQSIGDGASLPGRVAQREGS